MKKPKIELKKFKTFIGHDTKIGFSADLYVNGVKTAYVLDTAHGGCLEISSYSKEGSELLKLVEDYAKSLPKENINKEAGKVLTGVLEKNPLMIQPDVDSLIEGVVTAKLKEKENKKMKKLMEKKFLIGVPNGNSYKIVGWKRATLKQVIERMGLPKVQTQLNVLTMELKKGEKILNTNLESLGLKA